MADSDIQADWLGSILEPIAHSPFFAPFVSALILLAALWLALLLSRRLARPRRNLSRARSLLEDAGYGPVFAKAFPRIDDELLKDPDLGHAWVEFRKTLLPVPDEAIKATIRPDRYFIPSHLAGAVVNLAMFKAVPNYLVGTGLLFTFIGLVAALYYAGLGVTAPDIQAAQASLKALLQSATFKFMTSIAGLGGSILFSIIKKRLLDDLARRTDAFCKALESRMDFVTPVALSYYSHRELVSQSEQLRRFNDELGSSIATALDKTIGETMGRIMHPMGVLLERMTENMAEMNREAIERMLLMFTERLQGAASQEMEKLVGALTTVHGALGGLVEGIDHGRRALGEELGGLSRDLRQELVAAGDEAGQHMIKAGGIIEERLSVAAAAMEQRLSMGAQSAGNVVVHAGADASARLTQAATALEDRVSRAAQSMENALVAASGGLGKSGQDLSQAGDELAANLSRAAKMVDDKVTHSAKAFGDRLEPFVERLIMLDASLAVLDEKVREKTEAHRAMVTELNAMAAGLKDAAGEVGGAAKPLVSLTERMEDSAKRLGGASDSLVVLNRDISGLSETMGETSVLFAGMWKDYEARFGKLDEGLGKVFKRLQKGLDEYHASVDKFVGGLDASMGRSAGLMSEAVDGLSEVVKHIAQTPAISEPPAREAAEAVGGPEMGGADK